MILVFAGAGASAAVDPEQFPTTAEFYRRVPTHIQNNPWYREASSFLKSLDSQNPIDIEQVLGALREMQDYCANSLDIRTFPGWVLAPGQSRFSRLSESSEIEHDPFAYLDDILDAMRGSSNSLEELQGDINALVYELYAASPSDEALTIWIRFFESMARYELDTEVFTTNYDLVLENAIRAGRLGKRIGTGRVTDGISIMIDPAIWHTSLEKPSTKDRAGLLTKLHGSVDWQRDNRGRIVVGASRFTGQHPNHILIYPGFKGETQEEPFVTFHDHLRRVVVQAHAAIFIGYAFRDEFINEILSDMPSNIPKFVINTEQSAPDLDFLRESSHFGEGFTDESVTSCIVFMMQRGVAKAKET